MSRSLDSYAAEATDLREIANDLATVLIKILHHGDLSVDQDAEIEAALTRYRKVVDYEWK